MSTKKITIPEDENKDCFAYAPKTDEKKSKCKILKSWYNDEHGKHCDNCPFFKRGVDIK